MCPFFRERVCQVERFVSALAALAQKKEQGFKLGKPENLTKAAIDKGRQIRADNTRQHKVNIYTAD